MSIRPVNHVDLVLGGGLPMGEVWSISLAFGGLTTNSLPQPTQAALTTAVTHADTRFSAFWTNRGGAMGGNVNYDHARAYFRLAGDATARVEAEKLRTPQAGSGTVNWPNQCSTAISLRSDIPGRKNRGRVYMPTLAFTMGTNQAAYQSLLDDFMTFLTGVALDWTTDLDQVVDMMAGQAYVTHISCDNVPDTQRRRRDKAVATFTVSKTTV